MALRFQNERQKGRWVITINDIYLFIIKSMFETKIITNMTTHKQNQKSEIKICLIEEHNQYGIKVGLSTRVEVLLTKPISTKLTHYQNQIWC